MANCSPSSTAARDQIEHHPRPLAGWRHIRMVVILGALSAFGPLSIDTYLPSLPSLSRDLGANASAAQLTAGPLSDTLGRRRPLLVGLFAYILASLLCALSSRRPGTYPGILLASARWCPDRKSPGQDLSG